MKKSIFYVITIFQIVATIIFILLLQRTKLLPSQYMYIIAGVLLVLSVIEAVLLYKPKSKIRVILGIAMVLVSLIAYVYGGTYIVKVLKTIDQITQVTTVRADVGIYVRKEDEVQSISDMTDYTFGVMETLDWENTESVIEEVKSIAGDIDTKNYEGVMELIDSLLKTEETDAIIINSAFLEIVKEMEDYVNVEDQIRLVHMEQVENVVEIEPNKPEEKESEVYTIYISGIDSRTGLVAKSRSDVNILATVNMETKEVLLVSTPRDYYVPLSISNGVPDKLTHAGIYGVNVSMDTLGMLYETEVDYYFRVNFSGFEEIIDALGGVVVESDYAFSTGLHTFKQGENYMDGEAALDFARERYAFAAGDRQRGRNQMAVIEAVIEKAVSPALLTNFSQIMDSVQGSFETNIPYDLMAEVVRTQLDEGGTWKISRYSVDGSGASKRPYSMSTNAYVMIPNYDTVNTAIEMMRQVRESGNTGE